MGTEIDLIYPLILTLVSFNIALFASAHVVLYKRDVRAAIGWVGVIWLTPLIGSLLYFAFGINRLHRKAKRILSGKSYPAHAMARFVVGEKDVPILLGENSESVLRLTRYMQAITQEPLLLGNSIQPFDNGDDAYRAMLEAIGSAKSSVGLSTYIFDNDRAGAMFVQALAAAKQRGVEVRVLIDDVGARYTWPSVRRLLRAAGVTSATFLPTLIPWRFQYSNLRSHRKILVIDGRIGFTGGMNIREGHMASMKSAHPVVDMHFRLEGPVVTQLQETFVSDWEFCTDEILNGEAWFPPCMIVGDTPARGIADGPDVDHDKTRLTLIGALACAESSVVIQTPYFLPDAALINALNTADLRGVDVKVVLPEKNNLRMVQWASTAMLWQILQRGVQVALTPPPFDHTKLMIVDEKWVLFGSSNWDPRSLRLNFEFNVECYCPSLARELAARVREKIERSHLLTLAEVDSRPLPTRLRDGVVRLLSPYL